MGRRRSGRLRGGGGGDVGVVEEGGEEEVSVDVVLKQWWIFTPVHLSPLFIGVFVCVCVCVCQLIGVAGSGGVVISGCVNTYTEQFKQDTVGYNLTLLFCVAVSITEFH